MAKKYIKNEKGIVRAITSDNLQLEKPLLNENYDIEVHNRNMDKIDSAIQEVKGKIDGLELVASNVKMADGTTVEDTVSANKTSILNNTTLANQALTKANEAFQRGDNVKTQLVDKLISEGLNVSTNNTFEELISGIALGKKWASGTATSSSWRSFKYQKNSSSVSLKYITIPLQFVPTVIIASANAGSYEYITTYRKFNGVWNDNSAKLMEHSQTERSTTGYNIYLQDGTDIVNNTYYLPTYPYNYNDYIYNWIAFE